MTFKTLLPRLMLDGSKRSGWLRDSDDSESVVAQVGAKLITTDAEDHLLQLKVFHHSAWFQIVLNDAGDIVAYTVAGTEKDAWRAAQATLRRKEYVTD